VDAAGFPGGARSVSTNGHDVNPLCLATGVKKNQKDDFAQSSAEAQSSRRKTASNDGHFILCGLCELCLSLRENGFPFGEMRSMQSTEHAGFRRRLRDGPSLNDQCIIVRYVRN
jgi:hypothetical protein